MDKQSPKPATAPVVLVIGVAEIDPLVIGMLRTLLAAVITPPLALAAAGILLGVWIVQKK